MCVCVYVFVCMCGWATQKAYSMLLIGTHIDMDDGYALNVTLLCGAGFLRAVSSSLVWVYSTLVVQSMVLGPAVRSFDCPSVHPLPIRLRVGLS
jgi:hypothetical protein